MPRRLLGVLMLLLVSVSLVQAQGEAVLFTVGTDTVCRDEFVFHFGRSKEKRADAFAESYGRFKQKVRYAKELGLDTLQSVRLLTERYKGLAGRRSPSANGRLQNTLDKEWVRLMHVTYPLKQSADNGMLQKGKMYVDSVYAVLEKGGEVRFEELPWTQTRFLLGEWQAQLKDLKQGEFSQPFVSPLGVHLIAWKEKTLADPLVHEMSSSDEAFRMKELEEGLLVVALNEHWGKVLQCTEQDLETYFKRHRADYGGGHPHFKGAVIHSQSKKDAKRIKKYLRKYPEALWKEAIERMPEEMVACCRIEVGMYAIGVNPYVDKLVFKCADYASLPDYPYTWVLGEKLKKGPKDYRDVLPEVKADCFEAKKKAEMEAIMKKYRVEIDKEVLKTVNRAEI